MPKIAKLAWLALANPLFTWAQTAAVADTPAEMVVTIGHYYGHLRRRSREMI